MIRDLRAVAFFSIALLYCLPLAYNVGVAEEAPIDLALSNLALVLLPLFLLLRGSVAFPAIYLVAFPAYFIVFGVISAVLNPSPIAILLSTGSFVLPMLHLLVGAQFAAAAQRRTFSFRYFAYALSLVGLVMVASDILLGNFPRGCSFEGRWGGCFGALETYGFPNPPLNFLGVASILFGLFLIGPVRERRTVLALVSIAAIGMLCLMSHSRSALLVYFISLAFVFFAWLGWKVLLLIVPAMTAVIYFHQALMDSFLLSGTMFRLTRSIEKGDITTGRLDIWGDAIGIAMMNPLFGAAFVSFSNFSDFGTVHQQYLEVVYKVGLVGFLVYFGVIVWAIRSFNAVSRSKQDGTGRSKRILLVGFAVSTFTANLFQPLISYQVFGNLFFFVCGYFIAAAWYLRRR